MASKGIGINNCPKHGEYNLDAEDSPCPSCEDGEDSEDEETKKPECGKMT